MQWRKTSINGKQNSLCYSLKASDVAYTLDLIYQTWDVFSVTWTYAAKLEHNFYAAVIKIKEDSCLEGQMWI